MGPMGPPGAPGGHGEPPRGLPRPRGTRGRGPEPFLENPVFGSPAVPRPTRQNCLKTGSPASSHALSLYLNRSGLLFWSRWVPEMAQEPPRRPISGPRPPLSHTEHHHSLPPSRPGVAQRLATSRLLFFQTGSSFFRKPTFLKKNFFFRCGRSSQGRFFRQKTCFSKKTSIFY